MTKFVLHNPKFCKMDSHDVSHWILCLSTKGIEEVTLINMHHEPLTLPTHLFTCLELKQLKLRNFHVHWAPGFQFPKLLDFEFDQVKFEGNTAGDFIAGCPLLEMLTIREHTFTGNVKPFQIVKHQNLKIFSLSLRKLDTLSITSSDVFQLISSFPKLEELNLDFETCKLLAEAHDSKRVLTAFGTLKILTLNGIDLSSSGMVLCAFGLISGSANLQKFEITAASTRRVSQLALDSSDEDYITWLLEIVKSNSIKGLKHELTLIKLLLACSPLRKMFVNSTVRSLIVGMAAASAFAFAFAFDRQLEIPLSLFHCRN